MNVFNPTLLHKMHKKKVILIGSVDAGHPATGGETMKNQLFAARFRQLFDRVIVVDTFRWSHRPWCLIHLLYVLLFNRGAGVVISSSPKSAHTLLKFLHFVRLKKNVCYWVVGGSFHEKVKAGLYDPRYLHFLRAVIVQGPDMVEGLKACGVAQALYIPNSKPMDYFPQCKKRGEGKVRFVFLSRITPEKGCDFILESVRILNDKGLDSRFTVDFYGKAEDDAYADSFRNEIAALPNVAYRGFLNMQETASYDTLAGYDVMLFPTVWQGEGFPGVVLDAYIAGLPIIASDWNLNRNVVRDGQTGRIVAAGDVAELSRAMEDAITGKMELATMSTASQREARKYNSQDVLNEKLFKQLGLL